MVTLVQGGSLRQRVGALHLTWCLMNATGCRRDSLDAPHMGLEAFDGLHECLVCAGQALIELSLKLSE